MAFQVTKVQFFYEVGCLEVQEPLIRFIVINRLRISPH